MPECANVRYVYDGSFNGFLCCVYESVYGRELPAEIVCESEAEPTLYSQKEIATDDARAARVYDSFAPKIDVCAPELVRDVFFSCLPQKEHALLCWLLFAYKQGRSAMFMLGHPLLSPLLHAQSSLLYEAHLLKGFVRFEDFDGALAAHISPKNFVLPYLQPHFSGRYPMENYLIYDDVHHAALMQQNGEIQLVQAESFTLPPLSENEKELQALWTQFYRTIAIAARENPRCRMTHVPKRFWHNMTELAPEL